MQGNDESHDHPGDLLGPDHYYLADTPWAAGTGHKQHYRPRHYSQEPGTMMSSAPPAVTSTVTVHFTNGDYYHAEGTLPMISAYLTTLLGSPLNAGITVGTIEIKEKS